MRKITRETYMLLTNYETKCDKCGNTMERADSLLLLTDPPQVKVICTVCHFVKNIFVQNYIK